MLYQSLGHGWLKYLLGFVTDSAVYKILLGLFPVFVFPVSVIPSTVSSDFVYSGCKKKYY